MFSDYNEFIRLVFKLRSNEAKYLNSIPQVIKLAKRMGFTLTKNQLLPATLKVRENQNMLKEKLVFAMCSCLQKENEIADTLKAGESIFRKTVNQTTVANVQASKEWITDPSNGKQLSNFYKCFVGKGNNSMLVRTLFKSRFWWLLHDKDDDDKVNFLWTQLRKKSIMESLKCYLNPVSLAGLKNGQTTEKRKRKITSAQSRSPEHESPTVMPKPSMNNVIAAAEKPLDVKPFAKLEAYPYRLYNKIEDNFHLSNKKALWINMKHYYEAIGEDPFNALPVTFHIKEGLEDAEFIKF
jgi:hypothetical protein